MATILEFRSDSRNGNYRNELAKPGHTMTTGQVIIFPGVRIERNDGESPEDAAIADSVARQDSRRT